MANIENLKKTALHAEHLALKARMVEFGGWHMPIQYQGVIPEHKQVREDCGVFDVSHMGEILVEGTDASTFLQTITINDVNKLEVGQGQYTAMLNEEGGMIDDLILYRIANHRFLACVNAANITKDFGWIQSKAQLAGGHLEIRNESDKWSQIAVQGPQSLAVVQRILEEADQSKLANLEYMSLVDIQFQNDSAFLARTGYTGEHGYEIYMPETIAAPIFRAVIEAGAQPIGLGARDTLRLEACYLLYGNDMNDQVSPIEAGIGWAVKTDKGDFVGRARVMKDKDPQYASQRRKMVGFMMQDKGVARQGMTIYKGDQLIGEVTSGSHLPSLEKAGGMALVGKDSVGPDDEVTIDIRGKRKLAKIVRRPLYSPKVK